MWRWERDCFNVRKKGLPGIGYLEKKNKLLRLQDIFHGYEGKKIAAL